jgi:hypothetical protein
VAVRTFNQNRAFYTDLGKSVSGIEYDVIEKD